MREIEIQLPDAAATMALGAVFAKLLRKGDVVCLSGPLGAGKTTFARGVVEALAGERAPSPTYMLVEIYETKEGPLAHFDFYRLSNAAEAIELGLDEAMSEGMCLIEWPERVVSMLPQDALVIRFETVGARRKARLVGGGDWEARLKPLAGPRESTRKAR
ncbi:MAG: tRNA (adenosine(37)-N6)-threonylcarbamoyltransferase complex ATPase subunit type 1 TsaE [Parvularculaceae bacterium]